MSTKDPKVESREQSYVGRKFIGFVAENFPDGALKIGDVQVRVPDVHGDEVQTPTADLPIAIVRLGSIMGAGPGFGVFGVLPKNTTVCVEFQHGNLAHPMVTGILVTGENAASLPAEYLSDYPNVYGWKDPDGNIFIVNMATHTIKMQHKTGKFLKFEADGSLSGNVENLNAVVAGATSIISDGATTVKSLTGAVNVEATAGDVTVKSGAGNVTVDAAAVLTLKGGATVVIQAPLITEN